MANQHHEGACLEPLQNVKLWVIVTQSTSAEKRKESLNYVNKIELPYKGFQGSLLFYRFFNIVLFYTSSGWNDLTALIWTNLWKSSPDIIIFSELGLTCGKLILVHAHDLDFAELLFFRAASVYKQTNKGNNTEEQEPTH